jgi:hypothetical protein
MQSNKGGEMRKSFATLAVLALASSSASAAVIDDFTAPADGQTFTQTNVGTRSSQTLSGLGASVIGGTRQVSAIILPDSGAGSSASVKIQNPTPGAAELSFGSNTDAEVSLSYGTAGDLNADLSNGGLSNAFVVRVLLSDLRANGIPNVILVSTTGRGSSGAVHFDVPPLIGNGSPAPFDIIVPFASFFGPIDFSDIDTIELEINGPPSSNYTLDFFATNTVPEPASLSLFGIGAMGLLARRKRWRADKVTSARG